MIEYKSKEIRAEQANLRQPAAFLMYALGLLQRVQTGKRAVITAIIAGPHQQDSLHWQGRAFDMRSQHLAPEEKTGFLHLSRFVVGIFGGKVLLEDENTPNEHFHIQV